MSHIEKAAGDAFDRLLGEILGALSQLEAEGYSVIDVADAAVVAAVRKVQRAHDATTGRAWVERLRDIFDERLRVGDRLAEAAGERFKRRRLN
jgi:DNA-binding PadR family transcriptional regulator